MVDSATHSPESAPDWSLLDGTPSGEWKNDRKRLFIRYVEHEKGIKKHGAVKRACAKYSVDDSTYYYWVKHLPAEANGNGSAVPEADGNGHAESARKAVVPAPTPAATVDNERAILVGRLRAAYVEADAAAMELKDTLTDAVLMALSARIDELERVHGVIQPTAAVEDPTKRVAAEISALLAPAESDPTQAVTAEPATIPVAPAPIVETPVPAPIPTEQEKPPVPAPATAPVAVPSAAAVPVAAPKAQEKPVLTAKDRAILVMQATLGIGSAKYERLVDLTVEEAMRRHAALFPNATWSEKNSYENGARDMLASYDPARDGHPLHYIERRTMMRNVSREASARIAELGRAYNPKAFELARRRSKRDGLPKGVDHEFLKSEAYRTMGMLASIYDQDDFGDFWMWAEPLVEKALDAACGDEPMSFLNVKAKARADERQKTVGEVLTERALAEQLRVAAKPGDDVRHKAMVTFVNGLATGGTVSTIKEVLEVLLRSYMDDITALASRMHDEGVRDSLDECVMLLMRSTLKSGWLFDPRRPGNLDDYIRNGWTIALRG